MLERQESLLCQNTPGLVSWGCPVPVFGSLGRATVATLGINPSNREFMSATGLELSGCERRFPTLHSLGLSRWAEVDARSLHAILRACDDYFLRNPYRVWFDSLEKVVKGLDVSFFDSVRPACHLDLVPYATTRKWSGVDNKSRQELLSLSGGMLASLIRASNISTLVLNGAAVAREFQRVAGLRLTLTETTGWRLQRRGSRSVPGIAYHGVTDQIAGEYLDRDLLVLGYNHNLQSSFGVTNEARLGIRNWLMVAAGAYTS
ncbi:MAG: hypothetical protein FIB00_09170 [Chloroflexi bacterium]|nr:hypothetical protein [Chloroflexota bacterium]